MVTAIVFAATQEERIEELERIARYIPDDWIDENNPEVIPSPTDAKKKFNLTDEELFNDIMTLANKYSIAETNNENRICRQIAVLWVGSYGTTNDFKYLRTIMHNPNDYAQEYAIKILIEKTKLTELLIPIAYEIVTNKIVISKSLRSLAYSQLHSMCIKEYSSYVENTNLHSKIASFFLDRASQEVDSPLYVDQVACELNPSYRHSQQRRDNLARLRPVGLTGEEADIYNYRQRDAERVADDK